MTIPTLETDSGALELRMADGIEANAVAFDDVWHWPDGVSAGDGDVPKDGGGSVKVSTFLSEIIAGSVYIIHKNLAFGDGSTSSWFSSLNQMIYYEDGNVFEVKSAATLQLGELSGDWGINGSSWSVGPSGIWELIDNGENGASFLWYASVLHVRNTQSCILRSGNVIDIRNSVFSSVDSSFSGGSVSFSSPIASLSFRRFEVHNAESFGIEKTPDTMSDVFIHDMQIGIQSNISDVIVSNLGVSSANPHVKVLSANTLTTVDSNFERVQINNANGIIIKQYTTNIHISDASGSSLQGATVTMESYGNVVKNASTFYRCLVDHTAGTFATDLSAGKWIVTSAAIAAKAGVTGVDASTGLWTTGADYIKAETLFSEVTNSEGVIDEQIANYKRWKGTSKVLGSVAPYKFSISKDLYTTSVQELIAPTIISGTVQPLDLKWELESAQVASSAMTLPAMTMAGYEFPPVLVRPLVLVSGFQTSLILGVGVTHMANERYYVGQITDIFFVEGKDISGATALSLRVLKGDGETKETWTLEHDSTNDQRFKHTLTGDEGWDAHGTWSYQTVFKLNGKPQFGDIVTYRVNKVI